MKVDIYEWEENYVGLEALVPLQEKSKAQIQFVLSQNNLGLALLGFKIFFPQEKLEIGVLM